MQQPESHAHSTSHRPALFILFLGRGASPLDFFLSPEKCLENEGIMWTHDQNSRLDAMGRFYHNMEVCILKVMDFIQAFAETVLSNCLFIPCGFSLFIKG